MTYQPPVAPLFVPAHVDRVRNKAVGLEGVTFVLDLEDAVPPDQKVAARAAAVGFLSSRPGTAYVRINPLADATGFSIPCGEEDLLAVVSPGLKGVVAPKVESSRDLLRIDAFMRALEHRAGMTPGGLDLLGIVETAAGIAGIADIVSAKCARPLGLCFGAGDFSTDIGVSWTRDEEESRYARSALVIACRAAGLPPPIDSVFPDIRDLDALAASAGMARTLGFKGKFVIHPDQIQTVRQTFAPGPEEIDWARRVIAGMAIAESEGRGAFVVDGRLVDYPILERARGIIATAEIWD